MIIHVVNSGESLWQIAGNYSVSMSTITRMNELSYPNQLTIGQALVIPVPGSTHIVRPGESLWSIVQLYGLSVNAIIQANQLPDPNLLYPGTKLYIPPITHQIQPGETIWQLAQRYGTTAEAIINENQIENPNLVYPGITVVIPRGKSTIEVNAYTYQSNEEAVESINRIGNLLTYISPFAYLITENGTLSPMPDEEMVQAASAKNIVPMMSITNFTTTSAGSNLAHDVLATAEYRENLLSDIIRIMEQKGYRGVNVDFENLLPEDRELYNNFLQQTVDRLHPLGYFVSSAVAPKTSGEQTGLLYEAHDYEAHGRIVDFVVLMTYEWGYRLGPPQSISPIDQMRKVVEYALSVMPSEKIMLGFQIYARDWIIPHVQGEEARTFSPQEATELAIQKGATIQYDTQTQSPFYRYVDEQGQKHEVWFEDARSAQAKFNMIKEYNLRGVSYWALGYPFPQNWALLDNNFNIFTRV